MTGIYDEEILGAKQQEETARKLREGIKAPEGQMVSGWYVKPSITQYMAEGLKSYYAGKEGREGRSKYEGLTKRKQDETARLLKQLEPRADVSITPEGMRQFTQQPDISTQGIVSNALNPQPQGQMTNTTYTQPDDKTRMAALLQGMAVNPEAFQGAAKMEEFNILRGDKRDAAQQSADLKREQWARDEQLRRDLSDRASEDRRLIAAATSAKNEKPKEPEWRYDSQSDQWVKPPSEGKPEGERSGNVGKQQAAQAMDYLINEFQGTKEAPGILYTATTGGPMGVLGKIGRVTNTQSAKRFDNLREQMSTQLRTLFRIPGEGTLSDREQAQYGLQLPQVDNDVSVNESIIKDISNVIRIRSGTNAGVQHPANPGGNAPPAAIEYLKAHPESAEQFKAKYGYVP